VRSLQNARAVELGFAADRVLALRLDLPGAGYSTAEGLSIYDRLYERARALPGAASASLGVTEPFATTLDYTITIPGRDSVALPPSARRA
jgi:hypothetical protein